MITNLSNEIFIFPLLSSSKGNSSLIICNDEKILIDAGGAKTNIIKKLLTKNINIDEISAIIVTHCHIDHTKSIEAVVKLTNAKVFMSNECKNSYLSKNDVNFEIEVYKDEIKFDNFLCMPIPVMHDQCCHGFLFENEENKLLYLTDLGTTKNIHDDNFDNINKAYLESNHDVTMLKESTRYPYHLKQRILSNNGHLSNDSCSELCKKLYINGTRKFILGHISEENNTYEKAFQTVYQGIYSLNNQKDFDLFVAMRNGLDNII